MIAPQPALRLERIEADLPQRIGGGDSRLHRLGDAQIERRLGAAALKEVRQIAAVRELGEPQNADLRHDPA